MSLPHQSFVSSFPSQMEEYLQLFKSETDFYNQIVLGSLLPENIWRSLPHVCRTWLRNYVAGVLVYSITGFLWCFYIYYLKRDVYIRGGMCSMFFLFFFLMNDNDTCLRVRPTMILAQLKENSGSTAMKVMEGSVAAFMIVEV